MAGDQRTFELRQRFVVSTRDASQTSPPPAKPSRRFSRISCFTVRSRWPRSSPSRGEIGGRCGAGGRPRRLAAEGEGPEGGVTLQATWAVPCANRRKRPDTPRVGPCVCSAGRSVREVTGPVRYNVTPAFSAAAVTSSSRTEPPGWTIAFTRSPASPGRPGREERIGCGHRSRRPTAAALNRQPCRIDAIDLTRTDPDRRAVGRYDDRVGLDRPARAPGEPQIRQHRRVGPAPRGQGQPAGSSPAASIPSRSPSAGHR